MSMESLGQNAEGIKGKAQEKVKEAQEMRQEVEAMKAELSGMPGGLDSEIQSAIAQAEQAGRDAATSDITGVEQQAQQDVAESRSVEGQIDAKISENNTAKGKLEAIRNNKYGAGAGEAISAVEQNTSLGEGIKNDMKEAMDAAMSEINSAKSGI